MGLEDQETKLETKGTFKIPIGEDLRSKKLADIRKEVAEGIKEKGQEVGQLLSKIGEILGQREVVRGVHQAQALSEPCTITQVGNGESTVYYVDFSCDKVPFQARIAPPNDLELFQDGRLMTAGPESIEGVINSFVETGPGAS